MKIITAMNMAIAILVGGFVLGAWAEGLTVSDVTVRQRWPWSRLVDIDYMLTGDPTQRADVSVTAFNGSETLSLPDTSLSGDLYSVAQGTRRIVWDPMKTAYTNQTLTQFRVDLTPTNPPVYMIVDLTKSAGADGQIEYVYPGDARLETYGRFTNVWFGVTNESVYATDKIVLRRVSAGTFNMGEGAGVTVTLTKDFYVGVFEVTAVQWDRVMNNNSTSGKLPKNNVSYDDIRGSTNDMPRIDWYTTGSAVSPTNFIGRLRVKTGLGTFDLPTEAQWEYLCRAGTTSYYSDGVSTSSSDTNILNRLGWWSGNSGTVAHEVGGKEANGWGLYDTHGNLFEFCLDWSGTIIGVSDPTGPVSGSNRGRRGGSGWNNAASSASAIRNSNIPSYVGVNNGFRMVRTLP